MTNGWTTQSFEDCIEPVTYSRKIQRKDFLNYGEFPIVSQEAQFITGYWNDAADCFKVSTPVVLFGDHTQVLKYVDFDFVLGADGVKILQPRSFLIPKFFFYQLQAASLNSLGYARHYRLLKELQIGYPPFPEQKRIVGLLDEAFAGIATAKANAEKNLQNARALFESHLQSVFTNSGDGWGLTTIGEQVVLQRGFDITKDQQNAGDVPVVSSGGTKSYHDKAMAKAPGVVIGRKGTLGKVFYLDRDFWPHEPLFGSKTSKGTTPVSFIFSLHNLM